MRCGACFFSAQDSNTNNMTCIDKTEKKFLNFEFISDSILLKIQTCRKGQIAQTPAHFLKDYTENNRKRKYIVVQLFSMLFNNGIHLLHILASSVFLV